MSTYADSDQNSKKPMMSRICRRAACGVASHTAGAERPSNDE